MPNIPWSYWEWENPINPLTLHNIWLHRMLFSGRLSPDARRHFRLVTGEGRVPESLTFSFLPSNDSRCHLTNLSVDHFTIIASFLEKRDIQSARLSGRELHFFLSPYLFKSIRFAPHQESLDIVDNVSKDKVLSHNVHAPRFDASICRLPGVVDELDLSFEIA
jgi:hypothetical protein